MSKPALRITLPLTLFLLTVLAYWPGLSGGFLFDDYPNIVHQDRIHADELSAESLGRAARAYDGSIGRPLATITFALNYAIWGSNPWGFKITGLLIHAANALLVFILLRTLLALGNTRPESRAATAFATAMLWAVHPLQVSTVLYVVQRMETLSLTFVLIALTFYIRGRTQQIAGDRGWPWLVACLPLLALGLLSKETAALLPAYTLMLELTLLRFAAKQPRTSSVLRGLYALGLLAAAVVFVAIAIPLYSPPEVYAVREFSVTERLLTQLRVLTMYLGWIVVPQPSNYVFYYDQYAHSESLFRPITTLYGGALLVGLLGFAIIARRRAPLVALGLLWFFSAHLLTSNIIPLELVFEHRNYFAILGVLLVGVGIVERLPPHATPRIRALAVSILVGGAMLLTVIRSAGWGDPLHLAIELAENNPTSSRASTDLGEQYMILAGSDPDSEFYAMAQAEYERGSALPNSSPMPEQGLLVLAASAGIPAKPEWWDSMIRKLSNRAIGPQEFSTLTSFLRLREDGLPLDDRRLAEAYMVLVDRLQMPASQYYAFGDHALRHLKDEELAERLFRHAVDRSMEQPGFASTMAETLMKAGYVRHAQAVADQAQIIGLPTITLNSSIDDPGYQITADTSDAVPPPNN